MTQTEAAFFNLQLTTVFIEHRRRCADLIKTLYNMTYNEFTLLLVISRTKRPVQVKPLTEYVMLEGKTVLAILASLENREYIAKTDSPEDRRIILTSATQTGAKIAQEGSRKQAELMKEQFIKSLPESEYESLKNIQAGNDSLRGYQVEGLDYVQETDELFSAGHLIYWRVLIDCWTKVIRKHGGLSFNEFRILAFIEDHDALSPGTIAHNLILMPSAVTIHKATLLNLGLILEARMPADGRSISIRCTSKGSRLVKGLWSELVKLTRLAHGHLNDEGVMIVNAWYLRMYSNFRTCKSK